MIDEIFPLNTMHSGEPIEIAVSINCLISNQTYFASSFTKGKSSVGAIMHVKNDLKVFKIIKSTVLDKSFIKINVFELNLQSTLSLKEIRQGKTKETLV